LVILGAGRQPGTGRRSAAAFACRHGTTAVTASVTASIIPNQTTTYVSRLGVAQAF
jgi:hypothetical protein